MRSVSRVLLSLLCVATLLGCRAAEEPAPAPPPQPDEPRLLLFVSIDMAGMSDLTRYRSLYRGGLARLLDEGAVFTDAHHAHAETVTAVGHAALATGLHPGRSGIIGNEWFDRETESEAYCVGDRNHVRSPANLLATTLADWVKEEHPRGKTYGLSGKDQSAVLMGGFRADAAFWYDRSSGAFTSSTYYPKGHPDWLDTFNEQRPADAWFGTLWEPLPLNDVDLDALKVVELSTGPSVQPFPHAVGGYALKPGPSYYRGVFMTPFQDELLADLARTVIVAENLGGDDYLDVLSLSFSAADAVGHTWGPNSREYLDTLLRLDRVLGGLLGFIDERVGRGRVMIALSSDHGVQPLPEYLVATGRPGRRLGAGDIACFQGVGMALDERLGEGDWLLEFPYLNYELIAERNVTRREVEDELVGLLESCDAVARVWTRTQMEADTPPDDPYFRQFRNGYNAERSGDLFVQLEEAHLGSRDGTSHGSPYAYDTHVPIIIVGDGVAAGAVEERVHTVDLAPTLAALLGVSTPNGLDGVDRSELLRGAP